MLNDRDIRMSINDCLITIGTSPIIFYDLNVLYVRYEIKKLSQRYADRLEQLQYSD